MRVEDAVRDYLLLALRLDRLRPGTVDTYTGEYALREMVREEPRPTPSSLVRAAGRLAAALPDAGFAPERQRFLAAQLVACEWAARRLAGQAVPFAVEVEATFDTSIAMGREDDYRDAHRALDALLPGPGPLGERLAAHRRRDEVPRERLAVAVRAMSEALRARTREAGLVGGAEEVRYGLVDDAAWSALHRWGGDGRSRVAVNAGSRLRRAQLPHLVAHEAYPGHHTEYCRREAVLVGLRGWDEHRVVLVGSPQSLIAEGVAEQALHALVGPGWGPWSAGVLDGVGLGFDGELAERMALATAPLVRVRQDAALLLHDRRARPEDVHAYLRRWLLVDDRRAGEILRFLADPLWRGYTTTYVEGASLVGRWLDRPGGSRLDRLATLLDEPWTPSTLRAALITESSALGSE